MATASRGVGRQNMKAVWNYGGLRRGYDLSLSRQAVSDLLRQISGRPKLSNVLLLDGGDHPLALTSGSGHGCLSGKEMRTWALELEIGKAGTERGCERGRGNPYPLVKAANIKRLLTRLKIRLFPMTV